MSVNGCQKGKEGERELAKILGKWWGAEFVRSPGSGAFMTIHAAELMKQGYNLGGDLICPEDFPFSVESKRYASIDLYSILRNPEPNENDKSHLMNWWQQSKIDAKRASLSPLVCFRENRKQWYCLGEYEIFKKVIKESTGIYLRNDEFVIFPLKLYLQIPKEFFLNLINDIENKKRAKSKDKKL